MEYAVAMVNIVNPRYDMDDRDMCPFGTRRDSVCGGGTSNHPNHRNDDGTGSPTRMRRRILKKENRDEFNNEINVQYDLNGTTTNETACFQPQSTGR